MSSKRGRKRNDNLPPNRARDVQRAFRARRAAHLQALEQRVSELEEENGCLRQALNLPPSNRPPLGRGPTGKDKPKPYDSNNFQSLSLPSSRDSSSADSPASRASSESPSAVTVSMTAHTMVVVDQSSWNESVQIIEPHQPQAQHTQPEVAGPSEPTYHIAPIPIKPIQYPTYNTTTFPSTSRSFSNNLYTGTTNHYSHSSDRPMSQSYTNHNYNFRPEIRDETRTHYSYLQTFASHEPEMHSQTPPPLIHTHLHTHHSSQREAPMSYPHRRSMTDPHGLSIGEAIPHLPNPAQIPNHPRTPDYLRPHDTIQLTAAPRSGAYGPDSRLNHVP